VFAWPTLIRRSSLTTSSNRWSASGPRRPATASCHPASKSRNQISQAAPPYYLGRYFSSDREAAIAHDKRSRELGLRVLAYFAITNALPRMPHASPARGCSTPGHAGLCVCDGALPMDRSTQLNFCTPPTAAAATVDRSESSAPPTAEPTEKATPPLGSAAAARGESVGLLRRMEQGASSWS
jgi:hypothetical protein